MAERTTLNINIGVLGHVDSGKTSLTRSLATMFSTASLDKHPESKARGITLDLGFSAFRVPLPDHLKGSTNAEIDSVQYTLIDCPGHASLIRTIIGGAQIMDMMILVIDVIRGIQTQTAECLVIGSITCENAIIVLNKIDLIEESEREARIAKTTKNIRKAISKTKFANAPIVAISASVGGAGKSVGESVAASAANDASGIVEKSPSLGIPELVEAVSKATFVPKRVISSATPMLFMVDHCFSVRGQGTVLTGTVLQGTLAIAQSIEIPSLGVQKKIKTIEMFRTNVDKAIQGDRVGVCVAGLNSKLLERAIICTPGSVSMVSKAIALVKRVRYFRGACLSRSIFHITVGHKTVLASATFFGAAEGVGDAVHRPEDNPALSRNLPFVPFDPSREYYWQEELLFTAPHDAAGPSSTTGGTGRGRGRGGRGGRGGSGGGRGQGSGRGRGRGRGSGVRLDDSVKNEDFVLQWVELDFQKPVLCPPGSVIIGSRLDSDENANLCRIAFFGRLIETKKASSRDQDFKIRLYKDKERSGTIVKIDAQSSVVFVEGLFSKDANLHQFRGLRVETSSGDWGVVDGTYGTDGLLRVKFKQGLPKYVRPGMKLFVRLRRFLEKGRKNHSNREHRLLQPPAPKSLLAGVGTSEQPDATAGAVSDTSQKQSETTAPAVAGGETAEIIPAPEEESDEDDMDGWA